MKSTKSKPAGAQKIKAGPSGKMNPGKTVSTQKPGGTATTNPSAALRGKYSK